MSSILSQSDIDSIVADVRSIVGDDSISTSIDYHKISGTTLDTWSPTTGLIPDMYTISSVSAFKGSYQPEEISMSGGLIEKTDIKFIMMRDDVSGVLTVDDRIVEAASNYQSRTTYEIKAINRDPLAICYFIQARTV